MLNLPIIDTPTIRAIERLTNLLMSAWPGVDAGSGRMLYGTVDSVDMFHGDIDIRGRYL